MLIYVKYVIDNYTSQVNEECGDIPMVLVQNKIDLVEDAKMRPWVVWNN